jgi:hypothetical protein
VRIGWVILGPHTPEDLVKLDALYGTLTDLQKVQAVGALRGESKPANLRALMKLSLGAALTDIGAPVTPILKE